MTIEIALTLAILIITAIMFIFEIVRVDLAAMICLLLLGWTRLVGVEDLFSGFSSNAVIAMMSVMVLGKGISKTGAMDKFANFIIKIAKSSKSRLIFMLSITVGTLSGFIQNIGAASLFLPSLLEISKKEKISPSSLIMPIGFCAIIGGTLTMIGSGPMLITNGILQREGYEPFFIFASTPIGITLLLVVSVIFLLFGKYLLPSKSDDFEEDSEQEEIIDYFDLDKSIYNFRVSNMSNLCGKTIEEAKFWGDERLHVIAVSGDKGLSYIPWRGEVLKAGQLIALMGDDEDVKEFAKENSLESINRDIIKDYNKTNFAEVIISPRSSIVGKSIREYSFRRNHSLEPLILISNNEWIKEDFSDIKLKAGDIIVVYGSNSHISNLRTNKNFFIPTPLDYTKKDRENAKKALACFGLAIIMVLSGMAVPLSFATGAVLLILSKTLTLDDLYNAIEWKVVFLVGALMPLGVAMESTGTAKYLASNLFGFVSDSPIIVIYFLIAILSTLFSLFMSNVGAIVVLAPMIFSISQFTSLDPRVALLLAGISTANSFILPTHQVNALLMGPGGYKVRDYLKSGSIITVVFLVISVTLFTFLF